MFGFVWKGAQRAVILHISQGVTAVADAQVQREILADAWGNARNHKDVVHLDVLSFSLCRCKWMFSGPPGLVRIGLPALK